MAYITTSIPIRGIQKAIVTTRQELYQDVDIDFELARQIESYQKDFKQLDTREEKKKEKQFIAGVVLAFLLRKSKFRYLGYYAILEAIINTHVNNYKKVFIQQKVYEKRRSEIKTSWGNELDDITTVIQLDQTLNHSWHTDNNEYLKTNSYTRLANYVANAYLINQSLQTIQKALKTTKLQNQSVISSVRGFVPNENIRLYEVIRTDQVPIAQKKTVISEVAGRWEYHQWHSYTRTDFACYGVDGEIRKVGEKFSNGLYSPFVHFGCLCNVFPVF